MTALDLAKFYPCGHPRTPENSVHNDATTKTLRCKQCNQERRRQNKRNAAIRRCAERGHARVEYRNKQGHAVCVKCEDRAIKIALEARAQKRADVQQGLPVV